MHPAPSFHEADRLALAALLASRGFASIVGVDGHRAVTAAAPILLYDDKARFHLSARNALTPVLIANPATLAIVMADDAYVSPDWYAATDQVPTWNYRSVEIEGPARVLASGELIGLLDDISARYERTLAPKPPWVRAKMQPAIFEAMLRGIVGFELSIHRMEGTMKLSQNKPPDEIARVAAQLAARPDAGSQAISALMIARNDMPPSTSTI